MVGGMRTYCDIFSRIQSSPVLMMVETKLWIDVQLQYIPTQAVLTFTVPFFAIHKFILQWVRMRQGQKQAGEKFATPRKPPLGVRLVTKTLKQRKEVILVL
jgi:hypothetical protein